VIGNGATKSVRIVEGTGTPGALSLEAPTTTNNTLYVAETDGTATIDPAGRTLAVSKLQMQHDAGGLAIGTGSNNGTLTSAGTVLMVDNASTNPVTVHSVIANGTAASALTKSGAGPLVLTAANTYSGSTTVNSGTLLLASGSISNAAVTVNGGTLQVSGGSINTPAGTLANAMLKLDGGAVATVGQTLLNAAKESTLLFDSGTLSVHAGQPGLAAADWIGAGTAVKIADGGATLNTANGSATLNRPLLQDGSSTGGLTKAGANTLTLTAPATYAGRTVVQGGTLKLTPPAPIIYYDFDTASISGPTLLNRGSGGAAFNGVIAGAPATGVAGKAGEAFVFSATGQGVTTANNVSLVNGFSYAAWAKSSGPTNLSQRIINNYFAAGGYLGTGSDNKFNAWIAGNKCAYAPASDDTANWHHVALVWDGQKAVFFYDGVGIQTNTLTGVNPAYNSKIGFGNNPVPNNEFWNGALDEAYVFDRALTAAEVAGLKAQSWENVSPLLATTSLELNNNAILELSGISQTVTTLTLNNVLKARGDCTWGAPGSGAMYTSSQFAGMGVLRVLGPAAPATMISFF
jgi:autotransporter-associated beta strand protein